MSSFCEEKTDRVFPGVNQSRRFGIVNSLDNGTVLGDNIMYIYMYMCVCVCVCV